MLLVWALRFTCNLQGILAFIIPLTAHYNRVKLDGLVAISQMREVNLSKRKNASHTHKWLREAESGSPALSNTSHQN